MKQARYKGYLIDLDGTLFRGEEVIQEGLAFVQELKNRGLSFLYLTNNSTRRPEQVAEKLQKFGYPAHPEQVVTSAMATAQVIRRTFDSPPSVYAIGEEGLIHALTQVGCKMTSDHPDAVVVGLDRGFSYDKMKKAALAIRQGARFFGTNEDRVLPTEEGLLPGSGSLAMAVAITTGVDPIWIGKPQRPIVEVALKKLDCSKSEALIVGDNVKTDILAGVNGGIDTLFVTTGVTTLEEYNQGEISATYVHDSLALWQFI
ncbi:TIGR01457 family HAD-type hydrolase [Marininema halotolerans]|uniref:Acid sugar phosphatase n=1 Tax=Marininema halotolerans TaxID=1155944 RepID=A0A1I6RML8_9BACL|nr:TIGR01457 family HAD-type hydrolase [Marininema halotolerans]SFS65698.1 4-nitrophenyl phosphatase [Marininema halotolerans]